MSKFKLLIGVMAMTLALVLVAAPAQAGSKPLAVAADLLLVDVSNFNVGGVGNFIYTDANSGWNFTMWGDSGTGNATARANVDTTLNSNSTAIAICDFESGPVAVNVEGRGGRCGRRPCPDPCWPFRCFDQVAVAADLTYVGVSNFNAGSVFNGILTTANSGFNWNMGGDSETGNAKATASVSTNLNSNSTFVMVMEGGAGPAAVNLGGRRSLAIALEADLVRVDNTNLGLVANCVSTSANTGFNATSFGSSDTGNATAASTVASTVNSNSTGVIVADASSGPVAANVGGPIGVCEGAMVGGECMAGGSTAANVGTSGLAVSAEVDAVGVSNVNVGSVYNDVDTVANSGHNVTVGCPEDPCPEPDQCDPCGCDSVCLDGSGEGEGETETNTGDASASTTVSNTVNSNSTTVVIGGGTD